MGLIGSILGDIAGSPYALEMPEEELDYKNMELFTDKCEFTDDTVLSVATKDAVYYGLNFGKCYKEYGRVYPNIGWGKMFKDWFMSDNNAPYNSYGNGSAMRVGYISEVSKDEIDVQSLSVLSAVCTHNSKEGIKGAIVTAMCGYMAKSGSSKDDIFMYTKKMYNKDEYAYPVTMSLNELRQEYSWQVSCQGSVPVAIRCFLESDNYESCIRNVLSLKCDADTLACIAGGIAENYYGTTGLDNDALLKKYLNKNLYDIVVL
jgi:ADP-ribosylglycohydrolase